MYLYDAAVILAVIRTPGTQFNIGLRQKQLPWKCLCLFGLAIILAVLRH